MYLENSEQCSVATVEEEQSAKLMLTEHYQLSHKNVVEDLPRSSKGSTEPIKEDFDDQIVFGEEIKTFVCTSEGFSTDEEETESSYCNRSFESLESLSTVGNEFCEPEQIIDQFETEGLSQPFDKRAQHCECFEPCKSPEHCANHSLTFQCGPSREHCAEHLRSSQQCNPSNQQCDLEPEEVAACRDSFGRCDIQNFIHDEYREHLEAQQHEPLDQQDGLYDSEPEDCDEFDTTATGSDSEDLLDCIANLCEDDQMPYQSECSDNEACDPPEEHEAFEEETISPTDSDNPVHFCLDESQDISNAIECCEVYQENYEVVNMSSDPDEESETHSEIQQEYDTTELSSSSERTSGFFSEEDRSSECSSVETKSFKTCLGSIPSDHCSDSSEESDKEVQEESGDEQMQWESFEEDDELQQSDSQRLNEDRKKTPIVDIILEDYFDLFDRDDFYGRAFTPKCHYISCFDGGDIHARLYLEEINLEAQKVSKNTRVLKEIDEDSCLLDGTEQAGEDTNEEYEESLRDETQSELARELENQPDDWIVESESDLAVNHCESDEAEEEEVVCDFCSCDVQSSEDCGCPRGHKEKMCPPFVNDISVEGDAYEDEVSEFADESLCKNSQTLCGFHATFPVSKFESTGDSKDNEFFECSEMEPYWSLASHRDGVDLVEEPYVEEYYAYQIRSIETAIKQVFGGFMKKDCLYHQICEGEANEICWSKADNDAVLSLDDSESRAQVSEQQHRPQQSTLELDSDFESREPAGETTPPSGIIYSVVSEEGSEGPELRQEEEESDDESCDCDYCLPPVEQAPVKALLPEIESSDAGKICVVIDLDETLVHSSFKPVNNADFIIPVEIDGTVHQVYVLKRPHVDQFLQRMGELFECVLFTASLSKYADPVSDMLDKRGAFRSRLFRESCVFHKGNYVKDLSRLGRDLNKVIIIDNSPASYIFHPDNAVPVVSWFDDTSDTELLDLIPFFERLSRADDVYAFLTEQRTCS